MKVVKTEVLIIGAGPAGAAAAGKLHLQGVSTVVLEKTVFPRFVIGESLLPRCMDNLEQCGLLEGLKAVGFQEKYGAKFIEGDKTCDFNFAEQFTKGYSYTWQMPRADFDSVLVNQLIEKGVQVNFSTEVKEVSFPDDGVEVVAFSEGEFIKYQGKFLIDASGYGRVLPRLLDLDKPTGLPPRSAMFAHFKDVKRPEDKDANRIIVLCISNDVWVWIIPFSNGVTSVGFVGNIESLLLEDDLGKSFNAAIVNHPFLEQRFSDAAFEKTPQKISAYSSSVKTMFGDKFVLVGNATEFLDPVFSSGVTLALESGNRAADLLAQQLKGKSVDWAVDYQAYMQKGVDVFSVYVKAWYDGTLQKIFFQENVEIEIKERICSVLAGYVWDTDNSFVRKPERALKSLVKVLAMYK